MADTVKIATSVSFYTVIEKMEIENDLYQSGKPGQSNGKCKSGRQDKGKQIDSSVMYARDEETVLNVYEAFSDANYSAAVQKCFAQGKDIAAKEGVSADHMVYYDADYYYRSEEIHDLLKEAAAEYGAKYGKEIDASKRDAGFKRDYLTGAPNFNDKWNFMAANMMSSGRLMDQNAVPPRNFSFFYKQGTELGTKNSLLIIGGKDWSGK